MSETLNPRRVHAVSGRTWSASSDSAESHYAAREAIANLEAEAARAPAIAATGKISQMLGLPDHDRRVDWSTSEISRITPNLPERNVIRTGETRLLVAVLEGAIDDCSRLGAGLGLQYCRDRTNGGAESDMRDWLTRDDEDDHRFSLAAICQHLTAATGRPWRREAVSARLLAILDGKATAEAPRRDVFDSQALCGAGVAKPKRRRHNPAAEARA